MQRPVLLASRDLHRLAPHVLILRMAGYMTLEMRSLQSIPSIAECNMLTTVVIDHTFSAAEQQEFIERLEQESPRTHVITLKADGIDPEELVSLCAACNREARYGPSSHHHVHVLGAARSYTIPRKRA
jgi:hypothetical protein